MIISWEKIASIASFEERCKNREFFPDEETSEKSIVLEWRGQKRDLKEKEENKSERARDNLVQALEETEKALSDAEEAKQGAERVKVLATKLNRKAEKKRRFKWK